MNELDINNEIEVESDELYEHHKIVVEKGKSILRIDKYLFSRLENTSRNRIQVAAHAGNILVNNKAVKPNYKIKPLDVISILLNYPPRENELLPENIPLDIYYEDEDLVIINKQPEMVVHPAPGNPNGTLVNALLYHFNKLPSANGETIRPGLVHRLDKNTTGIMVIAKNELSLSILSKYFFDRNIERRYVALVWGDVKEDEGTIDAPIGRNIRNRKVMAVHKDETNAKHAVTHYKVLERFSYVTLVECKLETGRTHQIRVHLQHIGHPLFNDNEYGGDRILKGTTFTKYKQFIENCFSILPRQALHAKILGFKHPKTGKDILFEADYPQDMKTVIEKWREYYKSE